MMQASTPVRFHVHGDVLAGISVPCHFIKWIGQTTDGKTAVVLMDGEEIFVHETQSDAHSLWDAAVRGAALAPTGQIPAGLIAGS